MGTLYLLVICMIGSGFCISILHSSWIGRRIGTTPHCVRCGYDLSGRPEDSTTCSECGSDLSTDGAVQIGERHRRWLLFITCASFLVGSAVLFVMFTGRALTSADLIPHLPTWYLAWQAERENVPLGPPLPLSLTELLRRQNAGKLSQSQIDSLTARVLRIQSDPTKAWNNGWGDLIEQAWVAGVLPQKQFEPYLQQMTKKRPRHPRSTNSRSRDFDSNSIRRLSGA